MNPSDGGLYCRWLASKPRTVIRNVPKSSSAVANTSTQTFPFESAYVVSSMLHHDGRDVSLYGVMEELSGVPAIRPPLTSSTVCPAVTSVVKVGASHEPIATLNHGPSWAIAGLAEINSQIDMKKLAVAASFLEHRGFP